MCGWNCRGGTDKNKKAPAVTPFRSNSRGRVISQSKFRPCSSCIDSFAQSRCRRSCNISIKCCVGRFLIGIQKQRTNKRRNAARNKPQKNSNVSADYSLAGQDCQCDQRRCGTQKPQPIKLKPKQNKRHLFPSITRRDSVIASVAVMPGFSAKI